MAWAHLTNHVQMCLSTKLSLQIGNTWIWQGNKTSILASLGISCGLSEQTANIPNLLLTTPLPIEMWRESEKKKAEHAGRDINYLLACQQMPSQSSSSGCLLTNSLQFYSCFYVTPNSMEYLWPVKVNCPGSVLCQLLGATSTRQDKQK